MMFNIYFIIGVCWVVFWIMLFTLLALFDESGDGLSPTLVWAIVSTIFSITFILGYLAK